MNQTKRIVIINGDAFDADAIVAIVKFKSQAKFGVLIEGSNDRVLDYNFVDSPTRDDAMAVAVDAWRSAVGDLPVVDAIPPTPSEPLPDQPPPEEEESTIQFWSDTKGRYYDSYGGHVVYLGSKTGQFIWNEGPPRRKNPLGPGASPILKVYVDEAGKPLDSQPL